MRILITGANGQLGRELVTQLGNSEHEIKATNSKTLDITNEGLIIRIFEEFRPDVVINCASYTAVDDCELEENYKIAYSVNVEAVKYLAIECEKYNAKFFNFSTDYVFDGLVTHPLTEISERRPINRYGQTKMLSEDETITNCSRYFIIRTSWLYGDGNNFVKTMLRLGDSNSELNVVGDQIGSPTSTKDLTRVILRLMETDLYGVYHGTNHGECSWYEFAKEIFRVKGIDIKVNKVTSEEYVRRAKRPAYSVLDNFNLRKVGLDMFRPWQVALKDYLNISLNKGMN